MISLRPYQVDAVEAVERSAAEGLRRPVVSLATGLGKTVVFSEILHRRSGRALVLAHRDELVRQAAETVEKVSRKPVGVVEGREDGWREPVVVASVQSLQGRRLERWSPDEFDTVVVDECHHAVAPSFRHILDHFQPELLLGVTATPYRADAVSLGEIFDRVVYHYGILEGIRGGYLADIRAYRVVTGLDLDRVRTVAGDFAQGQLAMAVDIPARNGLVVRAYQRWAEERRALVFAASVEHARHLAEAFRESGIEADFVDGSMPLEARRGKVEAFRSGRVRILVNCSLLTEGFDDPGIEAVILARPTQSLALFTQMVGRGTRSAPGKQDVVLIDVADNTKRHRIVDVSELFGLARRPGQGASIAREVERDEERKADAWRSAASVLSPGASVSAEEVGNLFIDLSDLPEMLDWRAVLAELEEAKRRRSVGSGGPATEAQKLALKGFGWPSRAVRELSKPEAAWCIDRQMRSLTEWARKRAEVWSRILGRSPKRIFEELYRSPWQVRPVTEKQEKLMRKLGLKVPPGMTAGEASAAISAAEARRAGTQEISTAGRR